MRFAVAARAECPVAVIGGEPARRPIGPRWRVVVGTDGSEPAAAAVAFAADWALADSAALEVVTCTGDHPLADADPEALRAAAETIARTAADRLRTTHPTLEVTTRVEDSVAERTLIDAGAGWQDIAAGWEANETAFAERRKRFQIYADPG